MSSFAELTSSSTYHWWRQQTQRFFQRDWIVVLFLLVLTFIPRLRGISSQPTDWHAFRQSDTASVTREYVKHGIDLLHPKYQDHSNIQSGKENPVGYRMVEFPFVNALVAWVVQKVPGADLATTSRLVNVLFSLGTATMLFYLGKRWGKREVGIMAAVIFAVLPYAQFYSRAILPEPAFIFFISASIVWFDCWLATHKIPFYLLSVAGLIAALLLKPFALFLGPVFAVMALLRYGWKIIFRVELIAFVALAILPLWWWRNWIKQYPEGIPASNWLFNEDKIRFRPAWFRWLFLERITKLIMGWAGVIFLVVGMIPRLKQWQTWLKLAVWWLCILAYFSVLATGNVRHDYYQVFILPILCLTAGFGFVAFYQTKIPLIPEMLRFVIAVAILVGAVQGSWHYIGGYYGTRSDWETAGKAADRLIPADAKVIAPAFGDTAFLFQTNRTGWPIGYYIDKKIAAGAQYYVTTAYDDEARELEKKYPTVIKTPEYLILKLQ